jgi:16S rRNA (cytosine1402-N4)-methyltransferase
LCFFDKMIFKDKSLTKYDKYDKISDFGDSDVSCGIPHKPVMLQEVLHYLDPKNGETYIDCTFGAGGYTSAILESCECKVIGIDQDLSVVKFAEKISERFKGRFTFINENFSNLELISEEISNKLNIKISNLETTSNIKTEFDGLNKEKKSKEANKSGDDATLYSGIVDGIIFDLGVSSMQLEEAERGFSFRLESKLDMRMSQNSKTTAYDVVNFMSESELADIIYYNGEETKARKIAKYIVEHRKIKKIESTTELAEIIYKVIPKRFYQKIDPATKTFQAIRIYLNDELNNLRKALNFAHKLLKKGGRLIIVSFHSLEDKIAKDHLKEFSEPKVSVSKYHKNNSDDENNDEKDSKFVYKIISKKPFTPTKDEIYANQRSRSAKMRVAIKI